MCILWRCHCLFPGHWKHVPNASEKLNMQKWMEKHWGFFIFLLSRVIYCSLISVEGIIQNLFMWGLASLWWITVLQINTILKLEKSIKSLQNYHNLRKISWEKSRKREQTLKSVKYCHCFFWLTTASRVALMFLPIFSIFFLERILQITILRGTEMLENLH